MDVLRLRGAIWLGGATTSWRGEVTVGPGGVIAAVRPEPTEGWGTDHAGQVLEGGWVGPALVDAHVHLAFGAPELLLTRAVGAVRDLGSPLASAQVWRATDRPVVAVTGELLTAPGGYPTNGWGAEGFGWPVAGPAAARDAVRRLVDAGVDLVKLALEPANGQPVPDSATSRAVVDAAHESGLAVTCHALTAAMVVQALDAGVDELCHTPTEQLTPEVVERIAASGTPVVSTLQTFVDGGEGVGALANARALVEAGAVLVYGTDLGNAGTTPGASAAELERISESGLGRAGALVSATTTAAQAPGLAGRVDVAVTIGARTVLVVLPLDPLDDPTAWERPVAVVASGRVVGGSAYDGDGSVGGR